MVKGDRMRVLVLTNDYPSERSPGSAPCIRNQVETLRTLGVDVTLHVIDTSRKANYLDAAIRVATGQLRTPGYDLVHAHYGYCGLVARLNIRAPLVVTFRGSDLLYPGQRPLGLLASAVADHVIVMTKEMRAAAGRRDAIVLPYGVDDELFRPADTLPARRALGLPVDRRIVLFPWSPDRWEKRYHVAQAAVARLARREPGAMLLPVWGRSQAEIASYMNACDAMILTSDHEGSPVAVREAIACGLPVVSVDVGDVRDLVGRIGGCFIGDDDPESLADGLAAAIRHGRVEPPPGVREQISNLSVTRRLVALYESFVGRRSGRPGGPRSERAA